LACTGWTSTRLMGSGIDVAPLQSSNSMLRRF
jgi:hypothetical protein